MKFLFTSAVCLLLTACLSGGGGSTSALALAPEDSTPSQPPETPPSTPPQTQPPASTGFGLNYFSSKSLTSAYGSISLSAGFLTDAYCGHTMQVISQSELSGVVTIEATMLSPINASTQLYPSTLRSGTSYTFPSHNGCLVDIASVVWYYPEHTNIQVITGQPTDLQPAWTVVYTMSESNGTILVNRSLTSFPFRRATGRVPITAQAQSMNYNLH